MTGSPRVVAVLLAFGACASAAAGCASIVGIDDLSVDARPPADGPLVVAEGGLDAAPSDGAGVSTDAALDATGVPAKRVFVTSALFNGALGGLEGADAKCADAARDGSLGGSWVAFLGLDGASPLARLRHPGPFERLDGVRVVARRDDLAMGTLAAPIAVTERRVSLLDVDASAPSVDLHVWTGFGAGGAESADCAGWRTNVFTTLGTMGSLERIFAFGWTDDGGPRTAGFVNWGCQVPGRLYCFEL